MTEQSRSGLRELQRLDDAILAVAEKIQDLEHRLLEVEEPAQALGEDVETTRGRLQEMRVEERRRELAGEEKRTRQKRLEERLGGVRNVREESAVTAELDLVRRAREADEQEALSLLDQIRRLEDRLAEQSKALEDARAEVEPRRRELQEEREAATAEEARLRRERDAYAASLPESEIRVYEGIRVGGRRRALASLTEDGACGNCFNMVPLQVQNEIRHGNALIRCEACGVILAAPHAGEAPEASEE
ncbi:MAG TPA: C4-type zinc ribbon domain-containing protein [Longimicrobiales bacterium]|nr:C4-type zinc ribbon domain-containing protein [Longimicrobiales bacterium]